MKKHIITIAGELGSGKSSTAKALAEKLGYVHASTGDFMRSLAHERGLSLAELGAVAEHDGTIDTLLDDYNRSIGQMENVVIDSRLGFHFIPESFKVFLNLDPAIAAERILQDKKNNPNRHTESHKSFDTRESIMESVASRLSSEKKRYNDMYGIPDHTDRRNFDLVVDTGIASISEVAGKIIEEYKKWLSHE